MTKIDLLNNWLHEYINIDKMEKSEALTLAIQELEINENFKVDVTIDECNCNFEKARMKVGEQLNDIMWENVYDIFNKIKKNEINRQDFIDFINKEFLI